MVQRAVFESKSAALSHEFGLALAMRKFECTEQELESLWGRFSRGPRKGLLKGYVHWMKCTVGGWSRAVGGVVRPGSSGYTLRETADPFSREGTVHPLVYKRKHIAAEAAVREAHPDLTDIGVALVARSMLCWEYDMERAYSEHMEQRAEDAAR